MLTAAQSRQLSGSHCSCSGREAPAVNARLRKDHVHQARSQRQAQRAACARSVMQSAAQRQRLQAAWPQQHQLVSLTVCAASGGAVNSTAVAKPELQQPGAHLDQVIDRPHLVYRSSFAIAVIRCIQPVAELILGML